MRCPTCGRRVGKDQESCAFCGAYVRSVNSASAGGKEVFPAAAERKPMGSLIQGPGEDKYGSPVETLEPEFEEFEEEVAQEPKPLEAPPAPSPAAPAPSPPKYAGLLRILFPLLFILIPLFNLLVRNSPFGSEPDERPVLQEVQFFENIVGGRLINPQTVFSRSQHQRVVVFARWSGSRGRHSYTFRWYTPDGNPLPSTSSITRFQFGSGDDAFSAYGVLPLRSGLPVGTWRVEITVDEEIQGRPTFELRE